MDASQYPITTPFGWVDGYPLNQDAAHPGQGFHNGIDYGCPAGTPVVVNGVTIGLSGNTGYSTGAHCHVGRWVGGKSTDPGVGGGFHFDDATVTECKEDATNGKYVRVQADGASWVYLHLSDNTLVSPGQELKKEADMPELLNKGDVINFYKQLLGRDPSDQEVAVYEGKDFKTVIYAFMSSDEFKKRVDGNFTPVSETLYRKV